MALRSAAFCVQITSSDTSQIILCASRNPTSPSRSRKTMIAHKANFIENLNSQTLIKKEKMGTKNLQNRAPNPPKSRLGESQGGKMHSRSGPSQPRSGPEHPTIAQEVPPYIGCAHEQLSVGTWRSWPPSPPCPCHFGSFFVILFLYLPNLPKPSQNPSPNHPKINIFVEIFLSFFRSYFASIFG